MSSITKRLRYDEKGNIISSLKMKDGASFSTRKLIEYDENGNIASVREITEICPPGQEKKVVSDLETKYEYEYFDNKWVVTSIEIDGNPRRKTKYYKTYIASNGDNEVDSESTIFSLDNTRTHNLRTFQLTGDNTEEFLNSPYKPFIPFSKFNTASKLTVMDGDVKVLEEIKVNAGSSDFYCYKKEIEWKDKEGRVVETYFKDEKDDSYNEDHTMRFKEYNSIYTIDENYNVKNVEIDDDFIADVEVNINDTSNYQSICREVTNDQTGLKFYFYNIVEDKPYGLVNINMCKNENDEIIFKKEILNNEVINDYYVKYTESGDKVEYRPITTEFNMEDGLKTLVRTEDAETGEVHKESYVYNNLGKMVMRTAKFNSPTTGEYDGCTIYVYDSYNSKLVTELTESTKTDYIYDSEGREVFSILLENYSLSKEVFDFYYNKVIESVFSE